MVHWGSSKWMETFVAFALSKVLKKTIAQLNIRPKNYYDSLKTAKLFSHVTFVTCSISILVKHLSTFGKRLRLRY